MSKYFKDFDLSSFWEDSEYARKSYVEKQANKELIKEIEAELGYKLPNSYIELMMSQNGGIPVNTCFPIVQRDSWIENYVVISGIMGIGREKIYSLCGNIGSQFMITEWGYPDIGIYFGDCPSAGHDMICLDYSQCAKDGEPRVVHVDQESDYQITFLADNFEDFIKALVNEEIFEEDV